MPKTQHLINGQNPDVIMSRSYQPWRRQGLRKNQAAEKQPLKRVAALFAQVSSRYKRSGFPPQA